MADQVINGTFTESDRNEIPKQSIWSSLKGMVKDGYAYTGKVITEKVGPGLNKGAVATFKGIDAGGGFVVEHGGRFLESHDNIAILLSPGTAVKYFAIRAIDRKFKGQSSKSTDAAVTAQQ